MLAMSKLELDLRQYLVGNVIHAMQNDENTRVVELSLFDGGAEWVIPAETTVAVGFCKSDKKFGLYDTLPDGKTKAATVSGNKITVTLAPQVLTCAGRVDVNVVMYDSSFNRLGTFPFSVFVIADPSGGKSVSNNYFYLSTFAAVNEAVGNLSDLKTVDKSSLVAAINSLSQGNVTEEQIQAAVDSYLGENPVEATPLDPTLTKEGYAADAKAVGEALSKIPSPEVDLTGYATKDWVKQDYQPKGEYLTEAPVSSVNGKTGVVSLSASDVGALPSTYTPPDQTADQVGADPKGTAVAAVTGHNSATDAHGDIRLELKALADRLAAFLDSDDTTLDQLSELIAGINSNKTLIESVTTGKVNVSDIVNNLTTNVANKPLSAAQGVVLKGLIDSLSASLSKYALASAVPTKVSQLQNDSGFITGYTESDPTVPSWAKQSEKPTYTAAEVGALPANTVIPTVPTNVSAFTNDAGYLTKHQDISGKVDKTGLTLGIHTDGLVYLFVDGVPRGNGLDIAAEVIAGDVFGYVDENNVIILNGNLADGTYSLKYEMENGSTVDIGDMVLDSNVYHTITNDLTKCTNSNTAVQVVEGGSYSATISADEGYELYSVIVTMGGSPVTVTNGVINIETVTGAIVVTAVATVIPVEPTDPTNFAAPNTTNTTDWSIWCNDARFGSDGAYRQLANKNHVVTNYVAMEVGDIIRFEGLNVPTTGTSMNDGMHFSDADKAMLSCSYLAFYTGSNNYLTVTVTDGVYEIDTTNLSNHERAGASKYFRISGTLTGTPDDVIINVKRGGKWL